MKRQFELNIADVKGDSQYESSVTISRSYETDGKGSQRDSINGYYRQLTGRKFSTYWQSQGVSIELISQLQFTRFILDYQNEIIGRDIFLRNYEIDSSVIWAMVFNAMATSQPVEYVYNGQHISAYRTETGKRTYHGEKSDGNAVLKEFNRTKKSDGRKGRKSPRKNKIIGL